jgi:hypothetical protein
MIGITCASQAMQFAGRGGVLCQSHRHAPRTRTRGLDSGREAYQPDRTRPDLALRMLAHVLLGGGRQVLNRQALRALVRSLKRAMKFSASGVYTSFCAALAMVPTY